MNDYDYTAANRASWNAAAAEYGEKMLEGLKTDFQQAKYSCLDRIEKRILREIGVKDKAVAQLCCNNGRELLSLKNMGASHCVGFDISDVFIEQAKKLSGETSIPCKFVRHDIYDIPGAYDNKFDLVYLSVGTLGWMPDLEGFFQVAARLLKAGGDLFLYEMHPMLDMFDPEDDGPITLRHSYFRTEPYVEESGLESYLGGIFPSAPSYYWFHHKMSDVISSCLNNGLTLTSFREYGHDISAGFIHFEELHVKPPLTYSLTARKQKR